eukprot:1926326-Pyramimonas_sp.AAC.1
MVSGNTHRLQEVARLVVHPLVHHLLHVAAVFEGGRVESRWRRGCSSRSGGGLGLVSTQGSGLVANGLGQSPPRVDHLHIRIRVRNTCEVNLMPRRLDRQGSLVSVSHGLGQ